MFGFRNFVKQNPRLVGKIEVKVFPDNSFNEFTQYPLGDFTQVLLNGEFNDHFFKMKKEIMLISHGSLEVYIHNGQGDKSSKFMWRIYGESFSGLEKGLHVVSKWHDSPKEAAKDAHEVLHRLIYP